MSSHDCLSNYHSHYWNSGGISHRSSTNLQSSTKLELRLSQKFSIPNSSRFLSRHYSVSLEAADEKINSVFFSRNRMEAMWESCVIVFTRWSRTIYNNEKNESEEGRERWVSLTQSEIGRLNHSFSIYMWATRSRNDERVLCHCVHRRHLLLTRLTVSQDQNHAETARGQKWRIHQHKNFHLLHLSTHLSYQLTIWVEQCLWESKLTSSGRPSSLNQQSIYQPRWLKVRFANCLARLLKRVSLLGLLVVLQPHAWTLGTRQRREDSHSTLTETPSLVPI